MLCILLILASIRDILVRKVSNRIIIIGLITGFCIQCVRHGTMGIMVWFQGILFPIALLSILFLFHALGAGDIKLFSVVGGFLGPHQVVQVIFLAFIIGAVFSIIYMIHFNIFLYRLQYLANYFHNLLKDRKLIPYYVLGEDDPRAVIPFSVPISISVFIILVLDRVY